MKSLPDPALGLRIARVGEELSERMLRTSKSCTVLRLIMVN